MFWIKDKIIFAEKTEKYNGNLKCYKGKNLLKQIRQIKKNFRKNALMGV